MYGDSYQITTCTTLHILLVHCLEQIIMAQEEEGKQKSMTSSSWTSGIKGRAATFKFVILQIPRMANDEFLQRSLEFK